MVGPRAGVAQDDLATLLAHLAVVLVVRLVAVAIINCKGDRGGHAGFVPIPGPGWSPPQAALAHSRCFIDAG